MNFFEGRVMVMFTCGKFSIGAVLDFTFWELWEPQWNLLTSVNSAELRKNYNSGVDPMCLIKKCCKSKYNIFMQSTNTVYI